MSDTGGLVNFPLPDDSHVQTFHLERANIRGRIVRLGKLLDDILLPHAYPQPVAQLVAESVVLSVLLSSMLKYEGIFILQAQGDGAVTRLVSDVTSSGDVRATAGYDKEKLNVLDESPTVIDLFGKGYLAFTVDQGDHMERYQGIVELQGKRLEDSIHHYFMQSEQIRTAVRTAVTCGDDGRWRAGAVMLQHMPDHEKIPQDDKPINDHWNRTQILLMTCKDEELLDPRLHDDTLLYRLFHEEGVRVYDPQPLRKGCRCTPEKLTRVLNMLSVEDRVEATVDGKITMNCEFCNKDFDFDPADLGA